MTAHVWTPGGLLSRLSSGDLTRACEIAYFGKDMTADWWLTSSDPERMLEHLTTVFINRTRVNRVKNLISDRKSKLLDSAFVDHLDMNTAALVLSTLSPSAAEKAADLLREIVGNPWKPIELDTEEWCSKCGFNPRTKLEHTICAVCHEWIVQKCRWLTPGIRAFARGIYDNRDWEAMPVLGDMLAEAGCESEEILQHLRKPCPYCKDADFAVGDCGTPIVYQSTKKALGSKCACKGTRLAFHCRGCHVLDALLGLE